MKKVLTSALFVLASLTIFWGISPLAQASFVANDIIDDNIFDNAGTLNDSQIDTFLNGFASSCISKNNGFSSPEPTGYTPGGGFSFGGNVSAGKVIYDAAQVFGINPQVLLATMQKEQSLVTGAAGCHPNVPDPNSTFQCNLWGTGNIPCTSACPYSGGCITIAVGYNCPGNCQASSEGFSQQIIHAAWHLRFDEQRSEGRISWNVQRSNFPNAGNVWDNSDDPQTCYSHKMTQGNRQVCPGGPVNFYDGLTTIDGQTVHMDTGATAALYNYTPHFSGNQNFVSIFESWFGPTIGSLVRATGDQTVYLLSGATAYPIYDINVYNDFSALGPLRNTSASEINTYNSGPALGHVVGGSDGTLYLVNANIKLPFTSCSSVVDYGSSCSQVITLNDGQLNKLVNGPAATPLLKSVSNGTVYYISAGIRRPIVSWGDLLGFHVSYINTLTDAFVNSIPSNGIPAYGPGSLVKTANSGTVYMVKDINNLLTLGSFIYPQEFGLSSNVRTIASAYTVLSSVENKIQCSGTKFVPTNGGSYSVSPGMMANYGFNSNQFIDVGGVCNSLYFTPQPLDQFLKVSNGTIYYVSSGQKQAFTNFAAYQTHGGNTNNTLPASDFFAGSIPNNTNNPTINQ